MKIRLFRQDILTDDPVKIGAKISKRTISPNVDHNLIVGIGIEAPRLKPRWMFCLAAVLRFDRKGFCLIQIRSLLRFKVFPCHYFELMYMNLGYR